MRLLAIVAARGINAEKYLEDVIRRIDTTASEIASLTPWASAEQNPIAAESSVA